ncbi:MAG: ribbon-helix-helix domain-containing protein [Caldisericota bacterium]|nr:ribbon-helix-helix domain-containing protein [Caldisericota bacterium]
MTKCKKNVITMIMKKITILITDKQHRELKVLSKTIEVRMSEQIRRAIDSYLQNKSEEPLIRIWQNGT